MHCASGVSRSVAVVMALLMVKGSLSYDDALTLVRKNRPQGCPNIGFQRQLQLWADAGFVTEEAAKAWSAEAAQDIMEKAKLQRDAANSLHAQLDDVENRFAAERSASLPSGGLDQSQKASFQRELDSLQDKIDGCMGDCEDRVAKTILKAAAQKATRLLNDMES